MESDLQLLLALTALLAACAGGESLSIDDICRGIFPIEEVLNILSDPGICSAYKTPFVQFLLQVHLDCSDSGNDLTKE